MVIPTLFKIAFCVLSHNDYRVLPIGIKNKIDEVLVEYKLCEKQFDRSIQDGDYRYVKLHIEHLIPENLLKGITKSHSHCVVPYGGSAKTKSMELLGKSFNLSRQSARKICIFLFNRIF